MNTLVAVRKEFSIKFIYFDSYYGVERLRHHSGVGGGPSKIPNLKVHFPDKDLSKLMPQSVPRLPILINMDPKFEEHRDGFIGSPSLGLPRSAVLGVRLSAFYDTPNT